MGLSLYCDGCSKTLNPFPPKFPNLEYKTYYVVEALGKLTEPVFHITLCAECNISKEYVYASFKNPSFIKPKEAD